MKQMCLFGSNVVKLYHGSKGGIQGRIEPSSRESCDFGRGFYTGDLITQPRELICRYKAARMYEMTVDLSNFTIYDLRDDNLKWLLYVARNRGYLKSVSPVITEYLAPIDNCEVVIGLIADDSISLVLGEFCEGNLTDKALFAALTCVNLGNQYVFKTQRACDSLDKSEISYTDEDRKNSMRLRKERMRNMNSLVNKVKKQYRRDGLYFDEVIEKVIRGGSDAK